MKKFKCDLYNTLFTVCFNQKELDRLSKQWGYEFTSDRLGAMWANECSNDIVIFIKKKNDYGTIAHESLHAVNAILKRVGIKACHDNDEASAYLLDWIVSKITR